jgi:hypothetical protein
MPMMARVVAAVVAEPEVARPMAFQRIGAKQGLRSARKRDHASQAKAELIRAYQQWSAADCSLRLQGQRQVVMQTNLVAAKSATTVAIGLESAVRPLAVEGDTSASHRKRSQYAEVRLLELQQDVQLRLVG